jgi:rubrerythrin
MHASLSTVHWQCTRKAHYWSKAEAKAAQAEAKRIYGVAMRRYRCPFCGHYHLAKRNPDDATS